MDWNNINADKDTSGLGPIEYDQSKVPSLIRKHADNVRTKTYGQEVREAQARNAELAGLIASEAVDISNETKGRQDTVETQFNSVQQELTDKDPISAPEIIAARNGEVTLSARLDKDQQEVNAQLAQKGVNVQFPPQGYEPVLPNGLDQTNNLQVMYDELKNLYIPKGEYVIDGTLTMKNGSGGIFMESGVTLIRKDVTNSQPVISVKGQNQYLLGRNRGDVTIRNNAYSPYGVVSLGFLNMADDESNSHIFYNTLNNFKLYGNGIAETGKENIGLYLANPEITFASYYHSVSQIIITNVNTGVLFEGFANANIMYDLHFWQVGVKRHLNGASIKFKGTEQAWPVENIISNIFQDGASPGSRILAFEGASSYNILNGIAGEPGGASGSDLSYLAIDDEGNHRSNVINAQAVVMGGIGLSSKFRENNTLTMGGVLYQEKIYGKDINTEVLTSENHNTKTLETEQFINGHSFEQTFITDNTMIENKNYSLLTLDYSSAPANTNIIIEFTVLRYQQISGSNVYACDGKFLVRTNASGDVVYSALTGSMTVNNMLLEPEVIGKTIHFGVKVQNVTGAGQGGHIAVVDYKIIKRNFEGSPVNVTIIEQKTPIETDAPVMV